MLTSHHIQPVLNNAGPMTYGASAATVLFWGLHISDIAVIMSAFASVCGVALQFYVALHRIRRLEKASEANVVVTKAMAETHRAVAGKIETIQNQGDK